jgi:hypothetical protein
MYLVMFCVFLSVSHGPRAWAQGDEFSGQNHCSFRFFLPPVICRDSETGLDPAAPPADADRLGRSTGSRLAESDSDRRADSAGHLAEIMMITPLAPGGRSGWPGEPGVRVGIKATVIGNDSAWQHCQ